MSGVDDKQQQDTTGMWFQGNGVATRCHVKRLRPCRKPAWLSLKSHKLAALQEAMNLLFRHNVVFVIESNPAMHSSRI